ncbi:type II toxin-antitoxin system PemK/MazF family toxin [Roseburia sp. 1XD42-69]|uniref:type II toxin-antitoxin system PemK/MazF family toxin n=1 Tax=Roseburia sp. 1XD42-69 TaxID=2320088 RepID=UPI000EA1C943|nr:type II toxin-antitoxin system PemK/MazF family toxin [Roseburia sp. 1XD42-69]RKJ64913.1 type II toxin-antitoxin system PemK/MazF family toxin [Roseburia sp. 1XD42-69]
MAKFVRGDVVVIPFPFTDLSSSKKRPAVILADMEGDDYIMLQITSQNVKDSYAIPLLKNDFQYGSLQRDSNIRPNKIFTLDGKLILYRIGHITDSKMDECIHNVYRLIKKI